MWVGFKKCIYFSDLHHITFDQVLFIKKKIKKNNKKDKTKRMNTEPQLI